MAKNDPVGNEIKDLVTSLREWPVQMDLKSVKGEDFDVRVASLSRIYRPFEATPEEFAACKGSEPRFRGYPCSLWTTFHALTVNAAIREEEQRSARSGRAPNSTLIDAREEVRAPTLILPRSVSSSIFL